MMEKLPERLVPAHSPWGFGSGKPGSHNALKIEPRVKGEWGVVDGPMQCCRSGSRSDPDSIGSVDPDPVGKKSRKNKKLKKKFYKKKSI
jgi:hypothetical protein